MELSFQWDLFRKINQPALYNDIDSAKSKYATMDFSSMNHWTIIKELINIAVRHHIGMPQGIKMLLRSLVTIEVVLAETSSELNFSNIASVHMLGKHGLAKRA